MLFVAGVSTMFLESVIHGSLDEFAYVGLLLQGYFLGFLVWSAPQKFGRMLGRAITLICFSFIVLAIAVHGPPNARWIGGIHPNSIGVIALASGLGGLILFGLMGKAIYVLSLGVSIWVSSRYSVLLLLITPVSWYVLQLKRRVGFAPTLVLIVWASGVLLIFASAAISELFLLDDASRGIAGGGTGRLELAQLFTPQLEEFYLTGAGFRNRQGYMGVHNGYLNFILETGIVPSLFMFCLFAVLIKDLIRSELRDGRSGVVRPLGGRFAAAMLFGALGSSLFQPQLFNFGDAQGVLLILCLSVTSVKPTAGRWTNCRGSVASSDGA